MLVPTNVRVEVTEAGLPLNKNIRTRNYFDLNVVSRLSSLIHLE